VQKAKLKLAKGAIKFIKGVTEEFKVSSALRERVEDYIINFCEIP
jgi:hypothetical protein